MLQYIKSLTLLFGGIFMLHARASILDRHSFEPPFTQISVDGKRMVSSDFKASGSASVNKNFVRLTPDRQSKRGALWSRRTLGVDTFSTTLKFRISGQGKRFFGDGLALWVVSQPRWVEGELHGGRAPFKGFVVILDTFKNTESADKHKDILVLSNNGKWTMDQMMQRTYAINANGQYVDDTGQPIVDDPASTDSGGTASDLKKTTGSDRRLGLDSKNDDDDFGSDIAWGEKANGNKGRKGGFGKSGTADSVASGEVGPVALIGCDANFRYHESRADFDTTDMSRLKIRVDKRKVEVLIDGRDSGNWMKCCEFYVPLPEDWAIRSHIGLTATTGALADNHDVISLQSFSDHEVHDLIEAALIEQEKDETAGGKYFSRGTEIYGGITEERVQRIEDGVNKVMQDLDRFQAEVEHVVVRIQDDIENTIRKLTKAEEESEERIDVLEEKVLSMIGKNMDKRLDELHSKFHGQMSKSFESSLGDLESRMQQVAGSMGGWRYPFILLVFFLVGFFAFVYFFYQSEKKKMHLP